MRRYTPIEFVDAFWAKVQKGNGCWEWQGSRRRHGYGSVKRDRRMSLTHRAAWEIVNGPIPSGALVLHHCDNPPCVRPDHLFLGDQFANMRDRAAKGRATARSGEANGHAKLTLVQVRSVRERHARGEATIAQLAREHGVTWTAIGLIVRRKSWANVA